MDYVECPACQAIARRMPVLSYINRTDNFYQCDVCSVVSLIPKDATGPAIRLELALPRRSEARSGA
jgi:hypothetical protein